MDHSNHTTLLQAAGGQTAISERMRELLARAAQDHVYEQRTQGAVLDEIRQRLEGMEWLLREVRERELGGLSGTLETVSGRLDDIAAKPPLWAEGLAQHVEAVRDHVDAVGEQVGGVDSAVESVGKRVHPVMELPKLRADVTAVCEGMEETLGWLQTVVDFTDDMAKRMGDVTARLAQVSAGMEVAAGRFTRLDKSLAELNSRTDRVEGVVLDLSDTFDERVASAAREVRARVGEVGEHLSGRFDGVDGRVDRVESLAHGARHPVRDGRGEPGRRRRPPARRGRPRDLPHRPLRRPGRPPGLPRGPLRRHRRAPRHAHRPLRRDRRAAHRPRRPPRRRGHAADRPLRRRRPAPRHARGQVRRHRRAADRPGRAVRHGRGPADRAGRTPGGRRRPPRQGRGPPRGPLRRRSTTA
ncbi:hypothetical protein ACFSTC_51400 [Nonomuraea ferruginea]